MRYQSFLVVLLLFSISSFAQPTDPYSCELSEAHRQFDFWLGEWDVADKSGEQSYGVNRITRRADGCVLLEDYSAESGLTGMSFNYFDPSTATWHQHWVDSGSSIIRLSGTLENGAMVLVGSIYYLASGNSSPLRATWTPLADGRVRQYIEQADEAGQWQTWFDGYYRRLADDE